MVKKMNKAKFFKSDCFLFISLINVTVLIVRINERQNGIPLFISLWQNGAKIRTLN